MSGRVLLLFCAVLGGVSAMFSQARQGESQPKHLMLQIRTWGGLCSAGPCKTEIRLYSNGAYAASIVGQTSYQRRGKLRMELITKLYRQIAIVDFNSLVSVPHKGECPVNYDGIEEEYVFYKSQKQTYVFDSCKTAIAREAPIFVTVETIRKEIQSEH